MNWPSVSILLPIRNEFDQIDNTIHSLLQQDYPIEKLNIIVADGQSDDGTKKKLKNLSGKYHNITVVENPGKTMPKGFNTALRLSNSDVVLMMGGHSVIPKRYITTCIQNLQKNDADCAGGVLKTSGNGFWGKSIAKALSSSFGVGKVSFRMLNPKSGYVKSVAFGCYKKNVFDTLGLLDEELLRNQDDEFNYRLIQAGKKIWQDHNLVITYYARSSLSKLFIQYYQYGFYKVRVIQKRKQIMTIRHIIPSVFVAGLILSIIAIPILGTPIIFYATIIPYLFLTIVFAIKLSTFKIFQWLSIPIVFFVLHVSYGTGFLYGLIKFRLSWSKS